MNNRAPWRPRLLALALIAPGGCVLLCAFWLEAQPALLTVTALLLDRMFIPATVLQFAGIAAIVVGTWPVMRAGCLVAGGISIAVGVSVLLTFRQPTDYAGGVTLAALTTLAGGALVWRVRPWGDGILRIPSSPWRSGGIGDPCAAARHSILARLVLCASRTASTVGVEVSSDAATSTSGVEDALTVTIVNSGNIGALVISSELIVCYRSAVVGSSFPEELYVDPDCTTEQILDNFTEIDARSTWRIQKAVDRPPRFRLLTLEYWKLSSSCGTDAKIGSRWATRSRTLPLRRNSLSAIWTTTRSGPTR